MATHCNPPTLCFCIRWVCQGVCRPVQDHPTLGYHCGPLCPGRLARCDSRLCFGKGWDVLQGVLFQWHWRAALIHHVWFHLCCFFGWLYMYMVVPCCTFLIRWDGLSISNLSTRIIQTVPSITHGFYMALIVLVGAGDSKSWVISCFLVIKCSNYFKFIEGF